MDISLVVAFIGISGSLASVAIAEILKERHRRSEMLMAKSEEALDIVAKLRECCQRQFESINDYILLEKGDKSSVLDQRDSGYSFNSKLRRLTSIYFRACEEKRVHVYSKFSDVQLEYVVQIEKVDGNPENERLSVKYGGKDHHKKFRDLIVALGELENSLIEASPKWYS